MAFMFNIKIISIIERNFRTNNDFPMVALRIGIPSLIVLHVSGLFSDVLNPAISVNSDMKSINQELILFSPRSSLLTAIFVSIEACSLWGEKIDSQWHFLWAITFCWNSCHTSELSITRQEVVWFLTASVLSEFFHFIDKSAEVSFTFHWCGYTTSRISPSFHCSGAPS